MVLRQAMWGTEFEQQRPPDGPAGLDGGGTDRKFQPVEPIPDQLDGRQFSVQGQQLSAQRRGAKTVRLEIYHKSQPTAPTSCEIAELISRTMLNSLSIGVRISACSRA